MRLSSLCVCGTVRLNKRHMRLSSLCVCVAVRLSASVTSNCLFFVSISLSDYQKVSHAALVYLCLCHCQQMSHVIVISLCLCQYQTVNKRHMRRSRSLVSMLLWGDQDGDDDPNKAKNIHQTEILVDLRESILQVARHFQSVDPKNHKLVSKLSDWTVTLLWGALKPFRHCLLINACTFKCKCFNLFKCKYKCHFHIFCHIHLQIFWLCIYNCFVFILNLEKITETHY